MSTIFPTPFTRARADLFETPIMSSLIRVQHDAGHGIGVVVAHRWVNTYALTAAHVVKRRPTVRVRPLASPQAPSVKALVLACDLHADLALLRFSVPHDQPLIPLGGAELIPSRDETCLCLAWCDEDRPLVVESACVDTTEFTTVPRGRCLLIDRRGFPGRSGSPLLARGLCVGICYGSSGNHGIYVSLSEIHRFLRRTNFPWILAATSAGHDPHRAEALHGPGHGNDRIKVAKPNALQEFDDEKMEPQA